MRKVIFRKVVKPIPTFIPRRTHSTTAWPRTITAMPKSESMLLALTKRRPPFAHVSADAESRPHQYSIDHAVSEEGHTQCLLSHLHAAV